MAMKMVGLTEKQSIELCDNVGKLLVTELDADVTKNKVKKLVSEYVKKNKIDENPADLSNKLNYSVKVSLKK